MKNFSKHFGVIALIEVIALALAGCSPQVETVVVNSDGGANSIRKGDTISFSAAVTGKNNPSQNVKWSVSSKSDGSGAVADGTNISPSGTLIVDAKETASNIFVRATASQSADKFDYVQLKVEAASSVPRTATVSTATAQKTETAATPATNTTTTTPAASTSTSSAADFQMSGTTLTRFSGPKSINGSRSITIPNNVTSIGESAFQESFLSGPTSVTVPNSVTSIGDLAFLGNNALTDITLGNGVTRIGDRAFAGCQNLASITIPNSVTRIGNGAFEGARSLASITIPNNVTSIGTNAFYGTAWLNNQPDGLVYAGKVAYMYKGTMPTSITLLDGTKGIADKAFAETGLTSVTIPASVTSIGNQAFYGCTSLTSVTFQGTISSSNLNDRTFDGNLREMYLQNGTGTYTRSGRQWTKQ